MKPNADTLNQLNFHLNPGGSLACRVCSYLGSSGPAGDPSIQAMPLAIFQQALAEAIPLGLKKIRLSGDYAIAHPNLASMIEGANQARLSVEIETSNKTLTAQHVLQLDNLKTTSQVTVGLDTLLPIDAHALQGVRALTAAGIKTHLCFILSTENTRHITGMIALGEQIGAEAVHFMVATAPKISSKRDSAELRVEELIALGRQVESNLAPHTALKLTFNYPPAFRGLGPQAIPSLTGPCTILHALSILPNGEVALCGAGCSAHHWTMGRISENKLAEIWHEHSLLDTLRQGLPNQLQGICSRCTLRTTCLGSCVIQNFERNGNFWGPHWFCQQAEAANLFPASRMEL